MPCFSILLSGTQQSNMFSWYQRHGPFQTRPGSTAIRRRGVGGEEEEEMKEDRITRDKRKEEEKKKN